MTTTTIMIIGGIILAGIALWKGRKIFISKDDNGDYQIEISKLKEKVKLLSDSNRKNFDALGREMYKNTDMEGHINTKGMSMKKLRAIVKK